MKAYERRRLNRRICNVLSRGADLLIKNGFEHVEKSNSKRRVAIRFNEYEIEYRLTQSGEERRREYVEMSKKRLDRHMPCSVFDRMQIVKSR